MTGKKFTELDAASSVASTDIIPVDVNPGGSPATKKATTAQIVAANLGTGATQAAAGNHTHALGNHDHSGDAGDGGTFDAANLTSGAATDGWVLTADGSGGAAWEAASAGPGAGTELVDLTQLSLPAADDIIYVLADPDGAQLDRKAQLIDAVAGAVQNSLLVNEVVGWPPALADGTSLVGAWFVSIGTPSTAPTVTAIAGEAGVTETYERGIKCVTDAGSEGFGNLAWTYANEPRVKVGRTLSAVAYVWCVGGVGVTMKLVNSDASETAAAKVTAAAWTRVEIPGHTLAGTTCQLQFVADGAGTFYVAMPSANIGPRAFPLGPRPSRYVGVSTANIFAGDPGGSPAGYVDLDLTAQTSPLAWAVNLAVAYGCSVAGGFVKVRRNGSSSATNAENIAANQASNANYYDIGKALVDMDDGQVIEYGTSAGAGDTESLVISVAGWWEWA